MMGGGVMESEIRWRVKYEESNQSIQFNSIQLSV